jgi:hypothetical protein
MAIDKAELARKTLDIIGKTASSFPEVPDNYGFGGLGELRGFVRHNQDASADLGELKFPLNPDRLREQSEIYREIEHSEELYRLVCLLEELGEGESIASYLERCGETTEVAQTVLELQLRCARSVGVISGHFEGNPLAICFSAREDNKEQRLREIEAFGLDIKAPRLLQKIHEPGIPNDYIASLESGGLFENLRVALLEFPSAFEYVTSMHSTGVELEGLGELYAARTLQGFSIGVLERRGEFLQEAAVVLSEDDQIVLLAQSFALRDFPADADHKFKEAAHEAARLEGELGRAFPRIVGARMADGIHL